MKLGLHILGDSMRLSEIGQLAVQAEAAGLDSVTEITRDLISILGQS